MATRLYFASDTAAAVNPAFNASWGATSQALRRKMTDTKGSTALANGSLIDVGGFASALERQYVSTRMTTGTVFSFPTITILLQCREGAIDDNVDSPATAGAIVSEDGQTIRATIGYSDARGTISEYDAATMTSRYFMNAYGSSLDYTTVAGDRLVIEIGHYNSGGGTTPQAACRWGENGTDLAAEANTSTTVNGWIEFSNTITFVGEPAGGGASSRIFYRRKR